MNEAQFFYNNYPTAKEKLSYKTCLKMAETYGSFYIQDVFLALYLKVTDTYFTIIRQYPDLLKDEYFIKECLLNHGPNVHFLFAVGNGIENILKCVREVSIKENAKTVSWYRDDLKNIHIRRMLCQSQH